MTTIIGIVASAPSSATLALTEAQLQREVSRYLGFGNDLASLDDDALAAIEDSIINGRREVYFPFPRTHSWSFLQRVAAISVAADDSEYDLPEDFVSLSGAVTIDDTLSVLRQISPSAMQALVATSSTDNNVVPQYFSIDVKPATIDSGSIQYFVTLYPTPAASRTVRVRYTCNPPVSIAASPIHARLLIESCLAQAELMMNSEAIEGGSGVHMARFTVLLEASITADMALIGGLIPNGVPPSAQTPSITATQQGMQ